MMGMASGTVKTLKKGMLATLDRIASRQTALVVVEFEQRLSIEVVLERIKQVEGVLWAERASTTELERAKMRENQALMRLAEAQAYIKTLEEAPAGSAWAIGTELNLVRRLALRHPDKTVVFLDKDVCLCSTMNRIDLPHLV